MTALNITPLGHHVLLEIAPLEETSKGGIIIPESRERDFSRCLGTIVAIGPNAWKAFDDGLPWAEVGDQVLYRKHSGKRVSDPSNPDKEYVIVNDDELLCAYSKPIQEHETAEDNS